MASQLSPEQKGLLDQFREVTGVDEERAKFYLEAANWQLQPAMGGFFESGGEISEHEDMDESVPVVMPPPATNIVPSTQKAPKAKPPPKSGPMTLDALRNAAESDSSDDDDDKQAFYAGGSQSSGQQVLGPPKTRDEMIAEMFKKAREMGAEEMSPQLFKKKGGNETFGGSGYKLGDAVGASAAAGSSSSTEGTASASATPQVQDTVLHLWSNGFTVDDETNLRSYRDPNNLAFLDAVKRGEVPPELRTKLKGADCTLSIMDKRGQDFEQPKSARSAFTGKGQMLGSPAPVTIGSTGVTSEDDRRANEAAARGAINLAQGEPTTSIQFRLVDGSRLAAQFNHGHTVQDLYTFINTARPEHSATSYILTIFPNTELSEKSKSLKDANVLNSALTQKIK